MFDVHDTSVFSLCVSLFAQTAPRILRHWKPEFIALQGRCVEVWNNGAEEKSEGDIHIMHNKQQYVVVVGSFGVFTC